MNSEINTINDSVVAVSGDDILVMCLHPKMTRDEALRLAAYIVAMTDKDEFDRVYEAVCNT